MEQLRVAALYSVFVLLCAGTIWMLLDGRALRDAGLASPAPYSLARTQLCWWTFIILGLFILRYAITGQPWDMNETCLALLGISASTTMLGRMADARDARIGISMHQDRPSEGFFVDILSDASGP